MDRLENYVTRCGEYSFAGLTFAGFCGLLFTLSNFMAQFTMKLSQKEIIPAMEVVFARSALQLVILTPIILIYNVKLLVDKNKAFSLFFMSWAGFLNIVFIYLSLDKIPISDTLVISFTSPIFAAIFGYFILKEKIDWFDALCGIVSFGGIILVTRPTFIFGKHGEKVLPFDKKAAKHECETTYLCGAAYALVGGISLALYFVLTRKFATHSSNVVNIFYPSVIGTLVSPGILYAKGEKFILPETYKTGLSLASVGFLSVLALALLVLALKLENATYVSLVRNFDVVYSFVLQYAIMGIKPSLWSISGGVVIICATTCMAIRRKIRNDDEGSRLMIQDEGNEDSDIYSENSEEGMINKTT